MLIAGRGVTTETVEELLECLGGSKQIIDTELVPDWIRTKEEANRKKMLHIIALALNQGQV
ncbi:hypothetical protein A3A84_02185 [Candidatus Collierbacteria bacterium RIFCSPLOWO2_01_FULL_50_23]|nr:MAG: hypothetical protein A3A84_02185 [Candidatus Collierbacteria bacterium RIFCSPLOWO2_01_FULL_50_23]